MTLWEYNPITGYWRPERSDIPEESRDAYLKAYEASEPHHTFVYAKRKPRNPPPFKEINRIIW